ncbi:MAG: YeeE/YedE family protein [Deltaproteobacteria bacterium]|nr:YeeE/YedE family protein [Deltaproteobacteria bacterium]
MEWFALERWSPYTVGFGIGLLSWISFLLSDKALGCSTAFTRTSGMVERLIRGAKVRKKLYYQKFPPVIEWEWMVVVGIVIGAFISARLSGSFEWQWVPGKWAAAFGDGSIKRTCFALLGGFFMGVGARWAGGCTSGHGISGTLQLAVSSWVAAACFFIGGIGTAFVVYKVLG